MLTLKSLLLTLTFTLKSTTEEDWKQNYEQTWWLHFLIVNFPFISSNIPASPANGVYILQLVRYSRAYAQYSDFLDRAQLLTQKLLKQDYVAPRLESSLKQFYGRHQDLVDNYEIFISQMTMNLLFFT
jgi:hypothetical protein